MEGVITVGVGFWLVDEEPCPFDGALIDIVKPLRGAAPEVFPKTFDDITYGDEVMDLIVTSAYEEDLEPGDMMLKGLLGPEQWPVEIWWNQEMECGHVDSSCLLSTALTKLAARYDLTPPLDLTFEDTEIQEVSGWSFEATCVALEMIDLGDFEQELEVFAFVYSAFGREAEVMAGLSGIDFDSLVAKDPNGDPVQKFGIGPMSAGMISRIIGGLDGLNKKAELAVDMTVMWP